MGFYFFIISFGFCVHLVFVFTWFLCWHSLGMFNQTCRISTASRKQHFTERHTRGKHCFPVNAAVKEAQGCNSHQVRSY